MSNKNYLLIGGTHDGRAVQIPDKWQDIALSKKMRLRVPVRWEDMINSPLLTSDTEIYRKVPINQDYFVYAEKNLVFDDILMLLIDNYRPLAHRV